MLTRYSKIIDKEPREIVMLRGDGCKWRKCSFCDYHLDFNNDKEANYKLNKEILDNVTGEFRNLEVINSGSFVELDEKTMVYIKSICKEKQIKKIHFECHWMYKDKVSKFKKQFIDIGVKPSIKLGLETFDYNLREKYLLKGINERNPEVIAQYFDEINLLQGINGQNSDSMIQDIEIGLLYFEKVCVNIMTENSTKVKPDIDVINEFKKSVYPLFKDNERVDILLNNTDFGVG